ncbi:MAG: hypothetical protein WD770_07520 [Actinomycetota bacterium]
MNRRRSATALAAFALILSATAPALADHTDPRERLVIETGDDEVVGGTLEYGAGIEYPPAEVSGTGTWRFIEHFTANPGTDLKTFPIGRDVYASAGTLGQGDVQHVGQRIIRLTTGGEVVPRWVADHGSAACTPINPSGTTGLQHDVAVAPAVNPKVLIDATDATGRCHDPDGGGLEIVDISGIEREGFEARELHLTRHAGTSHTVTVDATRPWIVYNSSSQFAGMPWVDVLDIRTCLGPERLPLETKRERCRPKVYRIEFEPEWTQQRDWDSGELVPGSEAACHDITAVPGRLYCAGLNATLVLDVRNLTDARGNIRGKPLACEVIDGTDTTAKVTDCSQAIEFNPGTALPGDEEELPQQPAATGWRLLGTFNHPGRACAPPPEQVTNCNGNFFVGSADGISVSHEADPVLGGKYLLVTDERGGGVVPPSSSCTPGIDNPIGNGGAHVLDIRNPAKIDYALTPAGEKAVYRGEIFVPAATFCDIHVIEPIAGEHRILAAYYAQGTKIVDYAVDAQGRWSFEEVASMALAGANTWTVSNFKTTRNADGTRTYYFVASDIQRGIDVFSWTGPPNPSSRPRMISSPGPAAGAGDLGLLVGGLLGIPAAAFIGRRRRPRRAA